MSRKSVLPMVQVGPSTIGTGVFAARQFRKGQLIGEIRGQIIHGLDDVTSYCIELDETRSLEPDAPFRFLNHSCEPNAEVFSWDEPGEKDVVYLQALRTIRPGEELTIDYAWHADAAIRCQCGAGECRGWVVDATQLASLLKSKQPKRRPSQRSKSGRGVLAGAK